MKITGNTIAEVAYKIKLDDQHGEMIEFADERSPRSMMFGYQKMIPGFETHMDGMEPGQSFEFSLNPEEAFGNYNENLLINVPKTAFFVNGSLKEDLLFLGNEIAMMDSHGNPVNGKVLELTEENVRMDFNHGLAGKNLFVTGQVISVREITEADLAPQGGCGSGCGCSSKKSKAEDSCCGGGGGHHEHGGGGCGCSTEGSHHDHHHDHEYTEDCPACGNPAELRGKGHGDCQCA
ncbi:MAG: peptidylprolyl isomerase [Bacteroidetes bacterium HGW-Bacteroidetes-16]|jgi:FKBP-type peptidyl-prolyl cis-trans isomerase SlyD|nr:MAG: peptidylprolyl isomerase [Bacteroidetes bacterium HGW-Bacteroidetes-16]